MSVPGPIAPLVPRALRDESREWAGAVEYRAIIPGPVAPAPPSADSDGIPATVGEASRTRRTRSTRHVVTPMAEPSPESLRR